MSLPLGCPPDAYPTETVDSATQACLPIASDACLAGPTAGAPRLEALRE